MKNFRYSYRTKLFFLVTLLTWLIVMVFVIFSFIRDRQYRSDLLNAKMQTINEYIVKDKNSGKSWSEIDSINSNVRITVIDFEGNVIYDTKSNVINENHSNRSEFKNALNYGSSYTIRRASTSDELDYFYSATRTDSYIIRSSLPYTLSLNDILKVDYTYIGILIAIGLVITIIAWMFLSRATQSIRTLRDFAVNAEIDKDFNPDDYAFPNDELGDISDKIITLYNKQKQYHKEASQNLNQLLHEEQEKARIKQQLSSNISHELKTPIHAINACIETIELNYTKLSESTIKELINKSAVQSKRLVSLVQDLSLITRMSDGKMQIPVNKIDISDTITNIVNEMNSLPTEKRMRIHYNISDNIEIEGNADLIEAIFRNLITNAIDYSGGRDIFIEQLPTENNKIKFRFADNGIGISSEHLPKIFERFYRPDEGRNRKNGGTGLGLSIVKNAVIFHGGEISVKNLESGGLEFIFTLLTKKGIN